MWFRNFHFWSLLKGFGFLLILSNFSAVKINPVVFGDLEPSSLLTALGNDNQVLRQLTSLYEEMRGGYAIADATVSLQSISPWFLLFMLSCNQKYFLFGCNSFRFFAEVASQLGCDDLDAVTTENMTLEVKKYSYNENMLQFVNKIMRLTVPFSPSLSFICKNFRFSRR
jgi:hypothetical protein